MLSLRMQRNKMLQVLDDLARGVRQLEEERRRVDQELFGYVPCEKCNTRLHWICPVRETILWSSLNISFWVWRTECDHLTCDFLEIGEVCVYKEKSPCRVAGRGWLCWITPPTSFI